jgi:hypothetical protein
MKDYQASIQKLRSDAAEAALIRDLAADQAKREIFNRLHEHLARLADEVERATRAADSVDHASSEIDPPASEKGLRQRT